MFGLCLHFSPSLRKGEKLEKPFPWYYARGKKARESFPETPACRGASPDSRSFCCIKRRCVGMPFPGAAYHMYRESLDASAGRMCGRTKTGLRPGKRSVNNTVSARAETVLCVSKQHGNKYVNGIRKIRDGSFCQFAQCISCNAVDRPIIHRLCTQR